MPNSSNRSTHHPDHTTGSSHSHSGGSHSHDSSTHSQSGNQGFASMDKEKQREIAAEGGRAAHEKGTAHEFNSAEAREAGSKGGKATHEKGTSHESGSEEIRKASAKSHGGK